MSISSNAEVDIEQLRCKCTELDERHSELIDYLKEVGGSANNSMYFIHHREPKKREATLNRIHSIGYSIEAVLQEQGVEASYIVNGTDYQPTHWSVAHGGVVGNPPVPFINNRYVVVHELGMELKLTFTSYGGHYILQVVIPDHDIYEYDGKIETARWRMKDLILSKVFMQYNHPLKYCSNIEMAVRDIHRAVALIKECMPALLQCSTCKYVDSDIQYCGQGLLITTPDCTKYRSVT